MPVAQVDSFELSEDSNNPDLQREAIKILLAKKVSEYKKESRIVGERAAQMYAQVAKSIKAVQN